MPTACPWEPHVRRYLDGPAQPIPPLGRRRRSRLPSGSGLVLLADDPVATSVTIPRASRGHRRIRHGCRGLHEAGAGLGETGPRGGTHASYCQAVMAEEPHEEPRPRSGSLPPVPMRIDGCRRRVIRSITTFLVWQDGRIRIGARQLGRRLDSLPTPSGIGLGQLALRFEQPLLAGLGVRQLRRQRGRRLKKKKKKKKKKSSSARRFHFRRRPGLVPAVVRLDSRAIEGHLAQADQPHRHGPWAQPTERGFQLLLEACPEFADRGVVDRAPFRQPHEIHVELAIN